MTEKKQPKARKGGQPPAEPWNCETLAVQRRKDRVYVRAVDESGCIAFERSFGQKIWFKNLHPVISEEEFRRQRGIVKVFVKRYDKYGDLLHDSYQDYSAETGEYLYGQCRHPNNTITRY